VIKFLKRQFENKTMGFSYNVALFGRYFSEGVCLGTQGGAREEVRIFNNTQIMVTTRGDLSFLSPELVVFDLCGLAAEDLPRFQVARRGGGHETLDLYTEMGRLREKVPGVSIGYLSHPRSKRIDSSKFDEGLWNQNITKDREVNLLEMLKTEALGLYKVLQEQKASR
jgi:hypothetical protein